MSERRKWAQVAVVLGHAGLCVFVISLGNYVFGGFCGLMAILWAVVLWQERTVAEPDGEPTS